MVYHTALKHPKSTQEISRHHGCPPFQYKASGYLWGGNHIWTYCMAAVLSPPASKASSVGDGTLSIAA